MKNSKLVYIVSMGHSGSTLLDLLCSTLPEVFSTGEFVNFPWQLFRGYDKNDKQTQCSCGQSFTQCSFWNQVIQNINNANSIDIVKSPKKHDIAISRPFKYGKSIIYTIYNRILLFFILNKILNPFVSIFYKFHLKSIKRNWELFDTISKISNTSYVVDSSKDILRFWFLYKYRPNDVKLIILKRNVHGVATSSHHGLNDKLIKIRSNFWYKYYGKIIPKLIFRLPENLFRVITYEEMCERPNMIREKLYRFISDDNKIINKITNINPKKTHMVAGNPIRHKDNIIIRYDERWRQRINDVQLELLNKIEEKVNEQYH
jgi:hypothetical protein